jgi:hypothetical protein
MFRRPDADSLPRSLMVGSRVAFTCRGQQLVGRLLGMQNITDAIVELPNKSTMAVMLSDLRAMSPWESS